MFIDETRIRIHPRRLKHKLHQRFKMLRNGVPGPPECSRLPAAVAVQVSRPLPAKWRSPLKRTTPVLQHGWETDGKNGWETDSVCSCENQDIHGHSHFNGKIMDLNGLFFPLPLLITRWSQGEVLK